MVSRNSSAARLILQAREGSDTALGTLLNRHREALLRYAETQIAPDLRPKLAPSDVVQESLLAATRDFQQFRGQADNELHAWLLGIVSHRLIDGMRRFVATEKRRTEREVDRGDSVLKRTANEEETPSQLASLREESSRLLDAIGSLPPELGEVVQPRYLEGLTFPQIAERLQIPVTTCRRRWLEGISALAQQMGVDSIE